VLPVSQWLASLRLGSTVKTNRKNYRPFWIVGHFHKYFSSLYFLLRLLQSLLLQSFARFVVHSEYFRLFTSTELDVHWPSEHMPTHHQHCAAAAAAAAAVEESVSFQLLRQGYTMSQCIRKRFLRMRTRSQTTCGHRKCADTTGTVPVPWAAHFQCWKLLIYFSNKLYGSNFIKQYSETVMAWNYQNADCS